MGPLQLTRDRLDELERTEASMNVDDLAVALGKATLDCLNPRGPLAQYAQVRDVCTLSILVKSATKGPAVVNADDSPETAAVRAAANALVTSYDELGKELASETTGGARAAAFEASSYHLAQASAAAAIGTAGRVVSTGAPSSFSHARIPPSRSATASWPKTLNIHQPRAALKRPAPSYTTT